MSLQELMNTALPVNRKERFYSATVFPMLVCRDGFSHFNDFTSLIEGYPTQPIVIDATPANANIQFFTEYSFAESKIGRYAERFLNSPIESDVPDIMILIQREIQGKKHIALIAVEAKMFSQRSPKDLHGQMTKQIVLLKGLKDYFLRNDIDIVDIYNVALVPKEWQVTPENSIFKVITWQDLYNQFAKIEIMRDDYFLEVLRIALDKYPDLVSHTSGGQNNKRLMNGLSIYNESKNGTLTINVMGRSGGLCGKAIKEDLKSGDWRLQCYQTDFVTDLANPDWVKRNWFKIKSFVDQINALEVQ